jgi:hypothetical protein
MIDDQELDASTPTMHELVREVEVVPWCPGHTESLSQCEQGGSFAAE